MIESKTIQTTTEPIAKLVHWQNGQTAKRLTVKTDKYMASCMSRHKAGQPTGELTGQHAGCTFEQTTGQAYTRQYPRMVSRTTGQLAALAAISIIN